MANGQPLPVQQQKKDTVYINLFGEINPQRVGQVMNVCTAVIGQYNPQTLYFIFSSNGGDVTSGITLYNFLRSLPVKVVMHNIGSIDSIATVIFIAGAERFAVENSSFLFHGVAVGVQQGAQFNLAAIQEIDSRLSTDQDKIAGIIASRTKMTKREMAALFKKGESKKLDFALKKGVIDKVRECKVPEGEVLISIS
jgi:ATP-dependent Clp protease protease subunit